MSDIEIREILSLWERRRQDMDMHDFILWYRNMLAQK